MFLLVHFSIFGDLDWEGSNGDQQKTLQNPRHRYEHFIWGGFIIANRKFGVL